MPPKRPQKTQKLIEQEGRLLLAVEAIKNGRIPSIAAAARSFEVPRTTLSARIKGRQNKHDMCQEPSVPRTVFDCSLALIDRFIETSNTAHDLEIMKLKIQVLEEQAKALDEKFRIDSIFYPDNRSKILYAIKHLSKDVFKVISQFTTYGSNVTYQTFIKELEMYLGIYFLKGDAKRQLIATPEEERVTKFQYTLVPYISKSFSHKTFETVAAVLDVARRKERGNKEVNFTFSKNSQPNTSFIPALGTTSVPTLSNTLSPAPKGRSGTGASLNTCSSASASSAVAPFASDGRRSRFPSSSAKPKEDCLSRGVPCTAHARGSKALVSKTTVQITANNSISIVSARHFISLVSYRDHYGYLVMPRDGRKHLCASTTNALKKRVPEKYHSVIDIFMKYEADTLLPYRPEDHDIQLVEGATLPFAKNYRLMTEQKLEVIWKYIQELLGKGFIRLSSSQSAVPLLIVRKPNGSLRVCVNYRALNELTIKSRYPIPLINETLNRLRRAKIFSKVDVIHAFNRLRIKEGQEWLTAFNIRYSQFEYLVMPFGLCNTPASFQSYINNSLFDYLDIFCTAYLDDVLIFSDSEEEHTEHVLKVLRRLRDRGLQVDIDKCDFDTREVKYFGLFVTTEGIRIDPEKVAAIREWQTPSSVKDVLSFVNFAGFYRRFIYGFSHRTRPLTDFTKGSETYETKSGARRRPELASAVPDNPVKVYTDYRNLQHFITTKQLNRCQARWAEFLSEFNFKIMYRPGKQGEKPDILTRHSQDLPQGTDDAREKERFQTLLLPQNIVSSSTEYTDDIEPAPIEPENPVLPGLSDPPDVQPDSQLDEPLSVSQPSTAATEATETDEMPLETLIEEAYKNDEIAQAIIKVKDEGRRRLPRIVLDYRIRLSLADITIRDHRVWVRKRLYIPDYKPLRYRILYTVYQYRLSGHPGPKAICRGQEFRHVLVVIDRLTKAKIFEPLVTKLTEELIEVMHRRVFCTHGLPRSIVSDRGSAFTSYFWKRYCAQYSVKGKLSTAYHPETNGQSEAAVKGLKNYFRAYINYAQDNWVDFFPDAELAANDHISETTGMTLFFANNGFHSHTGVKPPGSLPHATYPEMEAADQLVCRTEAIHKFFRNEIIWSQETYARYTDAHRQPYPAYRIGNRVYVNAHNFRLQRESHSLAPKALGPWPITRIIDNKAYELALPDYMLDAGITPVFHPFLLCLVPLAKDAYPGQYEDPQEPVVIVDVNTDETYLEWPVREIVNCRQLRHGIEYKALFEGKWGDWNTDPPWQPWQDFKNCVDLVLDYYVCYPDKPLPPAYFLDPPTASTASLSSPTG
ncbi:uncharacterized protein KD926_010609 [Aspergillus affinis]|uniref:uncharacterized protein n=1 Tax=Aspergillus affinis TaxID=1070780 RepID=UPI0022FEE53B|nr:uncharacterized protein KD926_010609 [Aspergillus affinis]KAI9038564.1 hypothetical protein KD926_010609 [Aspergillus affinis]